MDHTPSTPAFDDRPLRLLERAPVPPAHKERLMTLVRLGQELALGSGADLQAEFGKEHVALIADHNQFLRLFRGGAEPGAVELWMEQAGKDTLAAAGFTLRDPEGAVFRLFGWTRVDPMQGPMAALEDAVRAAFAKARKKR
jgi:hypothetical protein